MATYRIKSIRHDTVQTDVPEEDAARFLRISVPKLREKARFHEPIRGAWYVLQETPIEPDPVPKEQLIKSGFKEEEWRQFCDDWHAACLRLAPFAPHPVAWLERSGNEQ